MFFETYDKADIKSRLKSWSENDCTVFGNLGCVGKWENINDSDNFAGLLRSRKCFMFSPLLKAFVLLLKLILHRKRGSFVKKRWLRSLYV